MRVWKILNGKLSAMFLWFIYFFLLWVFLGCGDGTSSSESDLIRNESLSTTDTDWQINTLLNLDSRGTVVPNVRAVQGSNGRIHIIYFSNAASVDGNLMYTLNYLIWIPELELLLQQNPKPQSPLDEVEGLDNSNPASLVLDNQDTPIIAYQGGNIREMGEEEQSDVMISLIEDVEWAEYTGAIGYLEHSSYNDGLAGTDLDLAVDSIGDIHLCFQFFYEGADADDQTYPDINYVQKSRLALFEPTNADEWAVYEETIQGNDFQDSDGVQNSVGYHCKIVLDSEEQPVVIYAEHTEDTNTYTLWAARKNSDHDWQREAIDQFDAQWRVNAISAAVSPLDYSIGVAYKLEYLGDDTNQGDHLRYVQQVDDVWDTPQIVDQNSWCGDFADIKYDFVGRPFIAYFDDRSHAGHELGNLKIAWFDGAVWQNETVSDQGDVGYYNSMWFDDENRINICSYSKSKDAIVIFNKSSDF